ncbi:MAG: CRISPR-associated endonuclease Cas1 [Flexilinea sp.]
MQIDFHELPKLRDSLSYLFLEHSIIDRKDNAIEYIQKDGRVMVPIASLCLLILGPGTSISHAAIKVLSENGCSVLWTGEEGTPCYAFGLGETRKAYHLLRQAELICDQSSRIKVIMNMYRFRFSNLESKDVSLSQLRGMEGARVKQLMQKLLRNTGLNGMADSTTA